MPNTTVQGTAEGVSRIKGLYLAWYGQWTALKSVPLPGHVIDAAADQQAELTSEILSIPPSNGSELAMKLIACTEHGADPVPDCLIDDAHDLIYRSAAKVDATSSALLDLQDQLGKLSALILLVEYAMMEMCGNDDGSMNALQTGMSVIAHQVKESAAFLNTVREDMR
jgi:hypothetical protein